MNLNINIIIILIIILFLINHFSNGQILTTLKRIFNSCHAKIESFTSKRNKSSNNKDINDNDIYEFINSLITKNDIDYESSSNIKKSKVSKEIESYIIDNLSKLFNNNKYFFSNIKLNQDLYYYENIKGKEIEPFIFTTNILQNNKNIGNYTLVIDCFLRYDKDPLIIKNLKIIKIQNDIEQKPIQISNNDLFIKSPNNNISFQNNETDSLIPSIDEILSI
jgi:hypothetical protein